MKAAHIEDLAVTFVMTADIDFDYLIPFLLTSNDPSILEGERGQTKWIVSLFLCFD